MATNLVRSTSVDTSCLESVGGRLLVVLYYGPDSRYPSASEKKKGQYFGFETKRANIHCIINTSFLTSVRGDNCQPTDERGETNRLFSSTGAGDKPEGSAGGP